MRVRCHLLSLVAAALLLAGPLPGLVAADTAHATTPARIAASAAVVLAPGGDAPPGDPLVTSGQLGNGFRYAIRPQPVPRGRLSLFLLVAAGSANEADEELGYAHFVEHLAFTGTRDFPGDSGIRTMQRFGLAFGAGVNAYTSRFLTVYEIKNLPTEDPAALAAALKILRNYAEGLTFDPEAVRRERDVILAEGRVREGRIAYWWERELEFLPPFSGDLSDREMEAVFAGTSLARPQIGTTRSIRRAKPEGLRAFYERWYQPDRMALGVAGEVDAPALVAAIAAEFGGLRAPGRTEAPAWEAPRWRADRVKVHVFCEPEAPVQIVTLAAAVPRDGADTEARRSRELAGALALDLIERRLGRTIGVAAQIEVRLGHEVPGWLVPLVRVRTSASGWAVAAGAMETEVRRAIRDGFTAEEFQREVEVRRRHLLWAQRDAPNRPGSEVALALVHTVARGAVFSDAADERRSGERTLGRLRPEDCRVALGELWPVERTQLVLNGPVPEAAVDQPAVRKALVAARSREPAPYLEEAETAAKVTAEFGVPGAVVEERQDPLLDCWFVQFDNGVRLNFKSTPYEHGRVRLRVAFGNGLLGTEAGREGLAFGIAALYFGGLQGMTAEQERELLDRSEIEVTFGFGADRLGMAATCPSGGVGTVLQLFAARLAQPAFRPEGGEPTRAFMERQLAGAARTSSGRAEDRLREHLFGGHPALTRPRLAESRRLSYGELKDWIEPQLRTSPIEISIAGDIDYAEAVASVARTFGALPLRSTVDPLADRRLYSPGAAPQKLEQRFQGKGAVGTVALAWRLPDVVGQTDDCQLRLLARILEDRIRVRLRQEMGKTYTPVVGLLSERALAPATLFLRCRVETAPKYVRRVGEAAQAVVAELWRDGATAEELERARLPLLREGEENRASNTWWLFVLSDAQSKPQYLEGVAEQQQILAAVTGAEVNAMARVLLAKERLCELEVLPE